MKEKLESLYPNRVINPINLNEIPNNIFLVYILLYNENPIVLGHGKKNRAKVIFDNINQITPSHLKALFVRLYTLFGDGNFNRYIIECSSKEEAKIIENNLHKQIGGNNRNIPDYIRQKLFDGIENDSISKLVLEIALRSSFDGLSDIRKWKADNILSNEVWNEISEKLQLQ
jgi:hypothetical protein